MSLTSSNWAAQAYVTGANPPPGRQELASYLVNSGTGFEERFVTTSDGGIGLNVYIAGGSGQGGAVAVSQTNPVSISLSGVTIGGVITVTSSLADPVWVTGSVYVLNPSSGSSSLSGVLTATITGTVAVSQTNVPLTQTVYITGQPLGVTGTVSVSGTASVNIVSLPQPLGVSGTVAVSNTGVFVQNWPAPVTGVDVLNLPATQSVFVVNQSSSSITGTVTVSGTGVFQVTGSVFVLNPSSASLVISGALEITSSQANPVWVTGNFTVSGSGGSSVIFAVPEPSPTATLVYTVAQTTSTVLLAPLADRLGYTIYNSSSANLHLYFGTSGTASYFLVPGAIYEAQDVVFLGDIYGRWSSSGTGAAVFTDYFGSTFGSASVTVNIGNFPPVQTITGTVTVAGMTVSGSTPIEAYPNALENVQFTRKKQLFDLDSDAVNYIGYAVLGTAVSAGAWAVKRLTFNASGNLQASEWSSVTASWSNRTSEVYS